MEQQGIEVRIWREEGPKGCWRCQVATAESFHSMRFDNHEALRTYISNQIDILAENHTHLREPTKEH